MIRIGHGYDVHTFEAGDHIVLGGVRIEHSQGLRAHSDGDAVLHAMCDALLGAAALGDIGMHFPDTDDAYRDVASTTLLQRVWGKINGLGYVFNNADITIIAQAPKMQPHIDAMRASIAAVLGVEKSQINVKATTTEKSGFIGRGEALAAHAVVLLETE